MTAPHDRPPATSDDFGRIESLFAECCPLCADARCARLDEALADRSDLREEIDALLAAHDLIAAHAPPDEIAAPRVDTGAQVGVYRLVEGIGAGGMGEVFRAERTDGLFTQQVAIKVMRATGVTADGLRRFRAERQILASLRHPHIVSLLDGGVTPHGSAYLVMELVDGVLITEHCQRHALPLADRLRLFGQVCAAVHYAHGHGVVHRDLKPANILVSADGTAKVLDFGVAKLLDAAGDQPGSTVTQAGLPGPLTPNYASPEQLRGLPITTACDVYALGILLYELVSGVRPYETQGQPLDRIVQIVLHDEPPRPSAAASGALPYPRTALRGDIDAIVAKAMSKEPGDRYDSAGELARDLTRALNREPVVARPASTAYVLRRMAARHKAGVSIGGLAIVVILAASATAFWQRQVARREQARAETLFRDVRQLANSLIFKVHDAVVPLAGSTEVRRTIVNDAVAYLERLEAQSGGDPTLRLELAGAYQQIAGILGDPQRPNLGDREGALRQFERSKAVAATLLAPDASYEAIEANARAGHQLSTLYGLKGDRDKAVATAREAVDLATRYTQRRPDDPRGSKLVAQSNFRLAWALPAPESIPVWERTLAYYEDQLRQAPDSADSRRSTALVSRYLAGVLDTSGNRDAAVPHHRRALELDEARLRAAPDDRFVQFDAAISYSAVGIVAQRDGRMQEADALLSRSVDLRRKVAASDVKDVQAQERLAYGLMVLGQLRASQGQVAAGRQLLAEAIRVQGEALRLTGDSSAHRQLANAWFEFGVLEEAARDPQAACNGFRRARQHFSAGRNWLNDHERDRLEQTDAKIAACK